MILPTASGARPTLRSAQALDALPIEIDGLALECLAARALWWPEERTLFVADVHLGKAESFRALGVPVPAGPQGPTAATLSRLDRLLALRPARTLVVLGDLLHARAAQSDAVMQPLAAWRARHASLQIRLLRGNHDGHAGDPPPHLGIETVADPARLGAFCLQHAPRHDWTRGAGAQHASTSCVDLSDRPQPHAPTPERDQAQAQAQAQATRGIALSGHLHPVIQLASRAGQRARLPCFCLAEDEIVLPAFGAFTGGAPVQRLPGRRYVAIAEDRLFPIA